MPSPSSCPASARRSTRTSSSSVGAGRRRSTSRCRSAALTERVVVTRRCDAGGDAAVVGHRAGRSEPDSRAAAQRPRLQPADAAAARRHRVAQLAAAGRSRHGHAGVDRRRAARTRSAISSTGPTRTRRATGRPGSAAGGLLGVDTVREFQVLVNNYSAEYGRSTGGIVTAVTRSGTNDFRGIGVRVQSQQPLGQQDLLRRPEQRHPEADPQPVRRPVRRADRARTARSSSAATRGCARTGA